MADIAYGIEAFTSVIQSAAVHMIRLLDRFVLWNIPAVKPSGQAAWHLGRRDSICIVPPSVWLCHRVVCIAG